MSHQFYFSPHILDNLPAPQSGFDVVQDMAEPALRMYITSRGVKSFFVRKRISGRDRRVIIGNYPETEIMDARIKAADVLKQMATPQKTHRKKASFRKIADIYIIRRVRRAPDSRLKLARAMTRHIESLFDKNIAAITAHDIRRILENISGPVIRNRMLELIRSIFNFAASKGYITENPTDNIAKTQIRRRVRPLNRAGLQRLMRAIKAEKNQNLRAAFLMLVYGFAPKSKIFSMQWRDLDFNNYTWNERPLSDAAVVLLQNMAQDSRWVFPRSGGRHLADPRASWRRVATAAKIPNLTMDDVHRFMTRQLTWTTDREMLRQGMNKLIADS